jgi:type VI secretion system protein ImpA
MSDRWDVQTLLDPIAADRPCGDDLDETGALVALDDYQLFGQTSLEPEKPDAGDGQAMARKPKEPRKSDRPPNWREIRDKALEMLGTSKDLRALAYLGSATLRTDGPTAFVDTIVIASKWVGDYWKDVYPRVEEDALLRTNALNCLADPLAVIDGLRRAPLVFSREHGSVSLRDCDIVAGHIQPGDGERRPEPAQVNAAFAARPIEELRLLRKRAEDGSEALRSIETIVRREAESDVVPDFDALLAQFARIDRALRAQMAQHPDADPAEVGGEAPEDAPDAGAVGVIRSRDDAIRALDRVADFFRKSEPSSPIPLFLERAKRLVAKDFLEVLADVAPDALAQARLVGGVKQSD